MRNIKAFLVVDLNGSIRAVKNRPRTVPTEVVVEVNLRLPTPPRIAAVLDIEVPEPPDSVVEFALGEWEPVEEVNDEESEETL